VGKHTATFKGKKVRVILRDGTEVDGRFLDRTINGVVILSTGHRIRKKNILRLLVLKGGKSRPGEV
jgi:hypothetical protein